MIFYIVHRLPDEEQAKAAHFAFFNGGIHIRDRRAIWLEGMTEVGEGNDDLIGVNRKVQDDRAGVYSSISMHNDVRAGFIHRELNVVQDLFGDPCDAGTMLLDELAKVIQRFEICGACDSMYGCHKVS